MPKKGYKHSEETKRKMSENRKGVIGEKNPAWKGGRYKSNGYWVIYKPDHPRVRNNKSTNCIFEHILVAEDILERYLKQTEIVHHIDGDKLNNNPENLIVLENMSEHTKMHKHLEKIALELVKEGTIKFDKEKREYLFPF